MTAWVQVPLSMLTKKLDRGPLQEEPRGAVYPGAMNMGTQAPVFIEMRGTSEAGATR